MIIPSIYGVRTVEDQSNYSAFGNTMLRVGEVKTVIYPNSSKSMSKKYIEYDVIVQHRENGTAVTKLYHNCYLADPMGGQADKSFRSLRVPDEKNLNPDGKTNLASLGTGTKVLILCVNGGHNEAVIISGVRNFGDDTHREKKGIHLEWEFNGVAIEIADDGSFSLEKKGPTKSSGERDKNKGADAAQNTKVSVDKDGTFRVQTKDAKQSVTIDHKNGTITVDGDKELTLQGSKINVGQGANEAALLGDSTIKLLGQLIDAINNLTVPTAWGPSGPPINKPQFLRIKNNLKSLLSEFIKVKKKSAK